MLRQSKQIPTLFESSDKSFNQMRDWEAVVTNHSIGTCLFCVICTLPFETSGTASCGSMLYPHKFTYIHIHMQPFMYIYARFHACTNIYVHIHTSRAGQAGGGSFKREKNYTPKKECAYRLCTRRTTNSMPKPRFLCAPAFGRSWRWRFGGGWLCFPGASVVVM